MNLIELFTNSDVQALIEQAIRTKKSVSFKTGTVEATIIPTKNSVSIKIEEKSEADKFKDYVKTLPDECFTKVCEQLGGEKIKKISELLNSENIDDNRSAILAFKNAVREYAITQITLYKNILKEC